VVLDITADDLYGIAKTIPPGANRPTNSSGTEFKHIHNSFHVDVDIGAPWNLFDKEGKSLRMGVVNSCVTLACA